MSVRSLAPTHHTPFAPDTPLDCGGICVPWFPDTPSLGVRGGGSVEGGSPLGSVGFLGHKGKESLDGLEAPSGFETRTNPGGIGVDRLDGRTQRIPTARQWVSPTTGYRCTRQPSGIGKYRSCYRKQRIPVRLSKPRALLYSSATTEVRERCNARNVQCPGRGSSLRTRWHSRGWQVCIRQLLVQVDRKGGHLAHHSWHVPHLVQNLQDVVPKPS